MIERFRVQNYKALRDVTLDLTPIHVLIGPNDTGKTSILEAITAFCRSVDHKLADAFTGAWDGRALVWQGDPELPISFTATVQHDSHRFDYSLSCQFSPTGRDVMNDGESYQGPTADERIDLTMKGTQVSSVMFFAHMGKQGPEPQREVSRWVYDALQGVQNYRWQPRMLSLPATLDAKRRFRMEPSGFGLATCLDDILGDDRNRFVRLESRFRNVFPHVESVKLRRDEAYAARADDPREILMLQQEAGGKGIYFELTGGGPPLAAAQVSDGMLLVLAYLAVLYLPEPPRVLLVEEPENGIHPKRLRDVLKILRELVKEQAHTQVILTTHSPYALDLFEPQEVTLCQRAEDGSISVHRLSESKAVREQREVFTLGEIWTGTGDEALAEPATPDEEPTE